MQPLESQKPPVGWECGELKHSIVWGLRLTPRHQSTGCALCNAMQMQLDVLQANPLNTGSYTLFDSSIDFSAHVQMPLP